jgi:hypothetical protein
MNFKPSLGRQTGRKFKNTVDEQFKSMNPERMKDRINSAKPLACGRSIFGEQNGGIGLRLKTAIQRLECRQRLS